MKLQVLFVDDEVHILEGLRHRLRRKRQEWDMAFVASGDAALAHMETHPVDVVVSDMRMPGMDGATLLTAVQQRYPSIIRIVLSGHAELDAAMRAIPVAHQFLTKPSEPGKIEEVVERVCEIHSYVRSEIVGQTVARLGKLPSAPGVYSDLVSILKRDAVSVAEVAAVISRDMAVSAKTLQFVNSAFFRLARPIVEIEEAVGYLGFETIKQVVLAAGVSQLGRNLLGGGVSLRTLQQHAMHVASAGSQICQDDALRGEVFVAGLLHDIGKLVLGVGLPEHLDSAQRLAHDEHCNLYDAEIKMWGVSHAEIGAYLLGLWGLPLSLVEAVANHHTPSRAKQANFGVLAIVHVADALVHESYRTETLLSEPGLDMSFLERLGLVDRLDEWREVVQHAGQVESLM